MQYASAKPSPAWGMVLALVRLMSVRLLRKRIQDREKRAPKVRSFSGPKNERTRWAPIMGARLVASKMGPKYGPTFGNTSQLNPQPSVWAFSR